MGAKYCDQRVCLCLSVCLSVWLCVCLSGCISQEAHVQISPNFLHKLPVTMALSSSVGNAICYVLPIVWITSQFDIMEQMGQNQRLRVSSSSPVGGTEGWTLPSKFGERDFCYSGPAAWNSLPSDLHVLTNTKTFKNGSRACSLSVLICDFYGAPGRFVERCPRNLISYCIVQYCIFYCILFRKLLETHLP